MRQNAAPVSLALLLLALSMSSLTRAEAQVPPCPVASHVCDFAAELNRWVLTGDLDAIVAQTQSHELECGPQVPVEISHFCAGHPTGERRVFYATGRLQSHGGPHSPAEYRAYLEARLLGTAAAAADAYGPGSIRLYTLGCPAAGAAVGCDDAFAVVFSALYDRPGGATRLYREPLIFLVQRPPGEAPPCSWWAAASAGSGQSPPSVRSWRGRRERCHRPVGAC